MINNCVLRWISIICYIFILIYFSLRYLPDPEANFGEDWANAVDFIAATHFCTDLQTTNNFQLFLPQRMLVEGDVLPSISGFSPQQNRVLLSMRALHEANQLTGKSPTSHMVSVVHMHFVLFFVSIVSST